MPRRQRRKLRARRVPEFARLLGEHDQCEVKYRNKKYIIVRRWDSNARSDTLHEDSELNENGQRKVLRKLGFTNEQIDKFFG